MARPRKNKRMLQNKLMPLRVTENEAKYIKALAKGSKLRLSVYLRNLLLKTLGVNKKEEDA